MWFIVWIFTIKSHFAIFIEIYFFFLLCSSGFHSDLFFSPFYRKVLGLAAATSSCFHHVGNKRGSDRTWVAEPLASEFTMSHNASHNLPIFLCEITHCLPFTSLSRFPQKKNKKNTTDQTNQLGLAKWKPNRHLWHQASSWKKKQLDSSTAVLHQD